LRCEQLVMEVYKAIPMSEYMLYRNKVEDKDSPNLKQRVENILSFLPSKLRTKGQRLLESLTRTGKFDWNEEGAISYEGQTEDKSNIVDLLSVSTNPYMKRESSGLPMFITAIKEEKVPQTLLTPSFLQQMNPLKKPAIIPGWVTYEDKFG